MSKYRSQKQQQQPAKTPSKAAGEQGELHEAELRFPDAVLAHHQSEARRLRKAISRSRRQMACRKGRTPFLKLLDMRRHLLQQKAQLLDHLAMAAPLQTSPLRGMGSSPMSTLRQLVIVLAAVAVAGCTAPGRQSIAVPPPVDQAANAQVVCERYADLQPIGGAPTSRPAPLDQYCYPVRDTHK